MNEQAVLVYLDVTGNEPQVYEKYDLANLEEQLMDVLAVSDVGEFDGHEIGPTQTTLYLYGPNAEALYGTIRPILEAYPLCRHARIVIRYGGPGALERVLSI
jgi:hypothetical protein